VHKRLHAAQAEEFKLLVECFRENPEAFIEQKCISRQPWTEQMFQEALQNCELVPQADPNTASHAQRLIKIMALKELQAANPSMYDPIAIDTAALKASSLRRPLRASRRRNCRRSSPRCRSRSRTPMLA
jgi:hypothetical protein